MAASTDNGKEWVMPSKPTGEFVRASSQFRNTISEGGEFPPEADRYHLYISLACPWAHRTLLARALKGLEGVIGLSVVHYLMGGEGWSFASAEDVPGCIPDTVNNFEFMKEVYHLSDETYDGRITVPVLFDKKTGKIVNNESSEIIRIFNTAFNELASNPEVNLYPDHLAEEIDEVNGFVYDGLNNGVYKAGFATKQEVYEMNARLVRDTLLRVEELLGENAAGFLVGDQLTEADIRLFTTTIRHDPVYVGHFKCNLITTKDLPNVLEWMKRIMEIPGVAETVNMEHIKKHYYMSHKQINPNGIVPSYNGPLLD